MTSLINKEKGDKEKLYFMFKREVLGNNQIKILMFDGNFPIKTHTSYFQEIQHIILSCRNVIMLCNIKEMDSNFLCIYYFLRNYLILNYNIMEKQLTNRKHREKNAWKK